MLSRAKGLEVDRCCSFNILLSYPGGIIYIGLLIKVALPPP